MFIILNNITAFCSGQTPFFYHKCFFCWYTMTTMVMMKDSNLIIFCIFISGFTQRSKNQTFQIDAKDIILGVICALKESQSGNIKRNKTPPSMRRTAIMETNDCFSFKKILEMHVQCSVIFICSAI